LPSSSRRMRRRRAWSPNGRRVIARHQPQHIGEIDR
jgi:hypothetical protein